MHSGPLTWDQRLWAGLLAVPTGSALAGPTAAQLNGLLGFEDDRVWVAVPGNHRRVARTGMVVVQSRVLSPPDVHPTRQPSRTSIERSVLDMSIYAPSERAVRAPLLAAVQQGLTTPDRVRDALGRRGRCRHRALIAETITDAECGVESLPESEFERIRRRRGLPSPTRQRIVERADGRYYLDADWDRYELTVEVQGIPHLSVANWDADVDRLNELSIDGRYSSRDAGSLAQRPRHPAR